MKKIVTLLATVSAVAFLAACSEQEDKPMTMPTTSSSSSETAQTSAVTQAAVSQEAPDFTLQSMDGKTVKLSDYKGKKVYLKFWASWCGPCRKSMPELMELAAKQDRDFEILTVIAPGLQGEKSTEQFPKWYQEQGYKDIPVLYDVTGATFQAYQIRSIPTEILIDSEGKVGNIHLGVISNDDAEAAFAKMK